MDTTRTILSLSPARARRGVTLIEVLTVVAILAIIGLLAFPSQDQVSASRCRNAARLLVSDIEYAQMCSFGNGANPCMIVVDIEDSAYFLARIAEPEAAIPDPGSGAAYRTEYGIGRASGMGGVTIESIDAPGGVIEFNALGALVHAADITIVLRHRDHTRSVTIDAVMGRAQDH